MLIKVSVLFVIGVFAGTSIAASIDCNIDECRKPMKIYEELRCKPIYGAKSCCPKRFECADDVRKADTNLCSFDGKSYKVGDVLRHKVSNNLKCLETCICSPSSHDNEPAKFLCSTNNCDGILDAKVDNGCVKIYTTDVKESTVCAQDETENLETCWESSVPYREGERFISKSNPCYECLCHKAFDNTTITENSHCRKLNCDIELKYKTFIQRGCLPIFEDDKCCPIDWQCPGKIFKRDVSEINVQNDSNESEEENYSTESDEVTTVFDESTTESATLVTLNLDPFRTPKEEVETSTEEQTKLFDEAQTKDGENIPSATDENEESSTTALSEDENLNEENEDTPVTTEPSTSSLDEVLPTNEANDDNQEEISSETESNTEDVNLEEDITTVPNIPEDTKQSDVPTTEEILENDENIPKTHLQAPKLEISIDSLELPFNSVDETTVLPDSTLLESATESHLEESSTEVSTAENFETTTLESDIEETTRTTTTEATKIQPAVILVSHRKPKLIIKPSTHLFDVIPPPPPSPSPTEFEQLLTTLKQYVERLENTLAATKASEIDPPATFVNYTVSRSSNENEQEENEETKSISKRSAPSFDLMPRYFKHTNKEKGCTYGNRHYKLGEKIRTDNECLDCLCLYSPIGHCTKKKQCEA